jgi:hypothetical protein
MKVIRSAKEFQEVLDRTVTDPALLVFHQGALPTDSALYQKVSLIEQEWSAAARSEQGQQRGGGGGGGVSRTPSTTGKLRIPTFYSFNVSSAPAVLETLGVTVLPCVFAVSQKQFLDRLDPPAQTKTPSAEEKPTKDQDLDLKPFAGNFFNYLNGTPAPKGESSVSINVTKFISSGQDLLRKGEAFYAEKFFMKAIGVLEAVRADPATAAAASGGGPQAETWNQIAGSYAMCIGLLIIAKCVQGKVLESTEWFKKLTTGDLAPFAQEVESGAARAVALYKMLSIATFTYIGNECSEKKLREELKATPTSLELRCKLLTTLFLSGKLEECLTEGLKLKLSTDSHAQEFGSVALGAVSEFLGPEHALVKALGVPPA